jgi:triphosphatase
MASVSPQSFQTSPRPAILPEMTAAEGCGHMLTGCIANVQSHLDAAAALDVESIHQLRVGIRRLRAVLALFAPSLTDAAKSFDLRLRGAGRVFGKARDWDVLLTEALPSAGEDGVNPDLLATLAEACAIPRETAHRALQSALERPDFGPLLAGLRAWAEDGAQVPALMGNAAQLGRPLKELAPDLLARLSRRVAKRAKGHRHASTAELHKLRKRVKVLRYAAELMEPVYGAKPVKPLVRRCKDLQEVLGRVNDAAAIPALLASLSAAPGTDLAKAVEAVCAWAEQRGATARRHVAKSWHALRDTKPFWQA